MDTLQQIYQRNKTTKVGWGDKGHYHSYINDYYAINFDSHRSKADRVLEIGVKGGHSLNMWKQYFFNAHIVGVDNIKRNTICPTCEVIVGDATDKNTFTNQKKFDIIIDDGSHLIEQQIKSFQILWDMLNSGGIYVIEDITNIDETKDKLLALHKSAKIYDFRDKLGRYDDVIVEYRKP